MVKVLTVHLSEDKSSLLFGLAFRKYVPPGDPKKKADKPAEAGELMVYSARFKCDKTHLQQAQQKWQSLKYTVKGLEDDAIKTGSPASLEAFITDCTAAKPGSGAVCFQ